MVEPVPRRALVPSIECAYLSDTPVEPRMSDPLIGMAYSRAASVLIEQLGDELDYVEFPYELLIRDDHALSLARERQSVLHCASLSLAAAHAIPDELISSVLRMVGEVQSPWLGEHLALISATAPWLDGHEAGEAVYDLGFAVSPPMTIDTLEVVARALQQIGTRSDIPVLVENAPVYLETPGSTMSQSQMFQWIAQETNADVLLDLAHLLITCHTFGLDPFDELAGFPLDRVREVHLSGVSEEAGVMWDHHSSRPPPVEYELLEIVLDRAPVRAITHEYNWSPLVSCEMALAELELTRRLVDGFSTSRL
jgi:uncharacterized protein